MKCNSKIEMGDTRLVRYCILEQGHLNNCVPYLPMVAASRCTAVSPNGIQCGMPKHATGRHMNGLICQPWEGDDHAKK